jgi:hypothetical protein
LLHGLEHTVRRGGKRDETFMRKAGQIPEEDEPVGCSEMERAGTPTCGEDPRD